MELLHDPQAWLSFAALALLEIVLGIDNIIFLAILVERLPAPQRRSARIVGLAFAMVTRIALLRAITWLADLRQALATVGGFEITIRTVILFAGGVFLVVKSSVEIREMLRGAERTRPSGSGRGFWMIILQIGLVDIVFSIDSVFAAVGLAQQFEVMAAAIVAAILVMMWLAGAIGAFIGRHPSLKTLALAFMVLVGGALIGEAAGLELPKGYLYFTMAFAAVVEWINIRVRKRNNPAP